jgi:hypothetical protein
MIRHLYTHTHMTYVHFVSLISWFWLYKQKRSIIIRTVYTCKKEDEKVCRFKKRGFGQSGWTCGVFKATDDASVRRTERARARARARERCSDDDDHPRLASK